MKDQLMQQARALSREERKKILMSFKELELHQHLRELFIAIALIQSLRLTYLLLSIFQRHPRRKHGQPEIILDRPNVCVQDMWDG